MTFLRRMDFGLHSWASHLDIYFQIRKCKKPVRKQRSDILESVKQQPG